MDSQLPDDLTGLVTGLTADEAVDGVAHTNLVLSTKPAAATGNFLDPWGVAYTYSATDRTLSCTPVDTNGTAMTTVVRHF